ncbi:MAG: hypothetical protein ACRCX8_10305 [Sarcina sp.]
MSKIVLGSGTLYCSTFEGTIPTDVELETPSNVLGKIKGGASLEYKTTHYEAKDDLGTITKEVITDEEAILKSGIMTWDITTLTKLTSTARVSSTAGKKTLKIGGVGNYDREKYVLRFVHKDAADGDIRVTIVGTNRAGLVLTFAKEAETVINAEFKAQPHDSEGTLIIIEETVKTGA